MSEGKQALVSFDPGGVFQISQPNPDFQTDILKLIDLMKSGYVNEYVEMTPINGVVTNHHFIDGVYIREVKLPKNVAVIGRVHTTEHFVIINGDCEISCADSHQRYIGYNTFSSSPGTQRAVLTFEDTVFTTIHHVSNDDMTLFKELANSHDGHDALKQRISVETYSDFCALLCARKGQ